MDTELKNFINENINLINQNSKKSWEEIYDKLKNNHILKGKFTTIMLSADIDPATILSYIPENYLNKSNITNYKIPDNVTSIGDFAFYNCGSLTNIKIPNGVTSIGDYAFYMCYSLLSINIPDNVEKLGTSAFNNCQHLRSVTIGNRVKYIHSSTFNGCPNLTEVIIHSDFIDTSPYSFSYCKNLKDIRFKGTKKQAIESGIGNKSRKLWREGSAIERIICIDGEITL